MNSVANTCGLSEESLKSSLLTDGYYSVRRYYVDLFWLRTIQRVGHGCRVLDLGGKKDNKRGYFHIEKVRPDLAVQYVNIDEKTNPDFLCSVYDLKIGSESYDAVMLSEVLEHLDQPEKALSEAFRVLKPGGNLLICTPFLFHKHADPDDFGRYTDSWYRVKLSRLGFTSVHVENQGRLWSVLAMYCKLLSGIFRGLDSKPWKKKIACRLVNIGFRALWKIEGSGFLDDNGIVKGATTGYGVVAVKGIVE
ncbi:class I SAM-dependent methyltransferase [Leptonema illini]|uniref:Methyltransferase type 11 n=1 Tax=Leptonema illini DSM 21528 TaxID=929563 RepID=H2CD60_9LEPT|nr:class I SAM-dependent methyltransferase [Leptonema illini]EHQ07536.1 Methyltransferase type 11 [Leptonema illini DSM 21528]